MDRDIHQHSNSRSDIANVIAIIEDDEVNIHLGFLDDVDDLEASARVNERDGVHKGRLDVAFHMYNVNQHALYFNSSQHQIPLQQEVMEVLQLLRY